MGKTWLSNAATPRAAKIEPTASIKGMIAATTPRNAISMNDSAKIMVITIMLLKSSSLILSSSYNREAGPTMLISKSSSSALAASTGSRTVPMLSSASSKSPANTTWARTTWPSSDNISGLSVS